jgi:hypothetical protein
MAVTTADRVVLVAALLAGVVLRLWVLQSPLGSLSSDEAIVGLMARHALADGRITAFFWGQEYGGSLEPLVTAGVFALVGSSTLALKAVPLTLSLAATLLIVPVGRTFVGERGARYAAAAFWVSTANYVWWSTKAVGFYWACLILGLLFLLLVTWLAAQPDRVRRWLALGLVGGLGWWTSPQILHFVLPGLGWLAWRLRTRAGPLAKGLSLSGVPALVGALPWIWHNVSRGFPSLANSHTPPVTFLDHLWEFFRNGVPVAMGLNQTMRLPWPRLVDGFYAALGLAVAAGIVRKRNHPPAAWLLLAVLAIYPFLYAMFPTLPRIGEGRYLLFLAPFVWLVFAYVAPRRRWVMPAALVPMLALTVVSLGIIRDFNSPHAPDVPMPTDTAGLTAFLEEHRVEKLVANYWIAYKVAFESRERIIATPVNPDVVRYRPFDDAVRLGPPTPYAFVQHSRDDRTFLEKTKGSPECYARHLAGAFVVYLPKASLSPEERAECPRVEAR